jgi:hypothetical protein
MTTENQGARRKKPEPHPRLQFLHDLRDHLGSQTSAVAIAGFIGPSEDGVVHLFPTPGSGEYIEIPETAILYYKQPDVSGPIELFLNSSVIVKGVSTPKAPIAPVGSVEKPKDDEGDWGGKECVEERIRRCKRDPDVEDKSVCDTPEMRRTFNIICAMFGDPRDPPWGGYTI